MDLNNMTRDELLNYADERGISLSKRMKMETMRERIVSAGAKADQAEKGTASSTTRIIIAKAADAAGDLPVTLTHNGVHTVIARGEPVDCPDHLVEQLNNAITTAYSQDENGAVIKREVQRYPYTRV